MSKITKRITLMSICLFLTYLVYMKDFGTGFLEECIFGFLIIIFSYIGIKNEGGS